jgi:hypothetical protein
MRSVFCKNFLALFLTKPAVHVFGWRYVRERFLRHSLPLSLSPGSPSRPAASARCRRALISSPSQHSARLRRAPLFSLLSTSPRSPPSSRGIPLIRKGWTFRSNPASNPASARPDPAAIGRTRRNLTTTSSRPPWSSATTFSDGFVVFFVRIRLCCYKLVSWADNRLDAFFASTLKPNFWNLPMSYLRGFSCQVVLPLAHTFDPEEVGLCFLKKF